MVGCVKNTSSVSDLPTSEASVSSTESVPADADTIPSKSSLSEEEIARLFVQAINDNNPDIFLPYVMSVETFYSIEKCTGLSEERQKEEAKKKEEFGAIFQMMKMGISNSIQQVHQSGYSVSMLGVELSSLSKKKKGEIKDDECSLVKDMEIIQMDIRVNKNKEAENIEEIYTMQLMKIDDVAYAGQVTIPTPK